MSSVLMLGIGLATSGVMVSVSRRANANGDIQDTQALISSQL